MLTNEIEIGEAVGIGPEPALAAVIAGAVLVAPGKVPEGHRHIVAIQPFPVIAIILISHGAHPVLTTAVTSIKTENITYNLLSGINLPGVWKNKFE